GMERHAARRRDIGQAGRQAGGQAEEHVLHGRRSPVGAGQHERVVGVERPRHRPGVLLAGAVEALHGAAAVRAVDPRIRRPELEPGELALLLDHVIVVNNAEVSTPLRRDVSVMLMAGPFLVWLWSRRALWACGCEPGGAVRPRRGDRTGAVRRSLMRTETP